MQISSEFLTDLWDKFWRDDDGEGNVVIWQMPNVPLISWAIFTTLSLFISGKTSDVLSWIAGVSLIVWAILEIFKGVNYFRRTLGLIVLVFAVISLIKNF
ncbi:MAG: hypothetical protein ACXWLH_05985 [Candidatus Saccharimonadales bacterium]